MWLLCRLNVPLYLANPFVNFQVYWYCRLFQLKLFNNCFEALDVTDALTDLEICLVPNSTKLLKQVLDILPKICKLHVIMVVMYCNTVSAQLINLEHCVD
jgi:uncharacterized membrane protein